MYHQYFGLTEPAFSIAVNPRYLYMSDQHKEALAHLLYGVNSGGFVLLTGEVGTGKTTIIRSLLEQIPDNTDIAMVLNPMASVLELIAGICDELAVEYDKHGAQLDTPASNKNLIDSLSAYLLENHRLGRNTVLLIDEAQLLSPEALEQIRLLTNLETNTKKLLQIVLVGQPELNKVLMQPRLRQLAQRITAKFHLHPLTQKETEAYIAHRLQVAGLTYDRNPFTKKSVIKKIHQFTGGIPRRINILCERIMLGLYGHNKHQVDSSVFNLAAREVVGNMAADKSSSGLMAVNLRNGLMAFTLMAVIFFGCVEAINFFTEGDVAIDSVQLSDSISTGTLKKPDENTGAIAENTIKKISSYKIQRLSDAQNMLFKHLNVINEPHMHPCWSKEQNTHQCETVTLNTWDDLKEINRPSVLTITTADKFTAYITLIKINGLIAKILDVNGNMQTLDLNTLGARWTGRVFYLWQSPPAYTRPVGLGDTGVTVTWLADQFALLDRQDKPLARTQYTKALQERVKIFQAQQGLKADGVLGMKTVLKLNEVLGIDATLLDSTEQ